MRETIPETVQNSKNNFNLNISTGPDLIKFGNAVLYSFTHVDGVISPKTLSFMRNGGDEEYAEMSLPSEFISLQDL